jgi:hypothetical protein
MYVVKWRFGLYEPRSHNASLFNISKALLIQQNLIAYLSLIAAAVCLEGAEEAASAQG